MLGGVWAVVRRELTTSARRRAYYQRRVVGVMAVALAATIGVVFVGFPDVLTGLKPAWEWESPRSRVHLGALSAFWGMAAALAVLCLGFVPAAVAWTVTRERFARPRRAWIRSFATAAFVPCSATKPMSTRFVPPHTSHVADT